MNIGMNLFAQVMEYVPWKTFGRMVRVCRIFVYTVIWQETAATLKGVAMTVAKALPAELIDRLLSGYMKP